jgi:hypothetical protein
MRLKIRCDGESTVLLQNFLDLNWALASVMKLLLLLFLVLVLIPVPHCENLSSHGEGDEVEFFLASTSVVFSS